MQNPYFQRDNSTQMSWVRVTTGTYPHNYHTACCLSPCVPGEFIVSLPGIVNGVLRGTALVHKECLIKFLEDVPDEQTVVRARWHEIREKHTVKSSTSTP